MSRQDAFDRLAKLLNEDHFGVEFCEFENFDDFSNEDPPTVYYLNTGETYSATILLTDDEVNGTELIVSSWGDWIEEQEAYISEQHDVVRCCHCSHWTHLNGKEWREVTCHSCGNNVSGG